MSKFKKGDKVWFGEGGHARQLTVKKVIDNPMIPVYQYTFEEADFACGEQSLKLNRFDEESKITDCFKDGRTFESIDSQSATKINTIASAKRHPIRMEEHHMERMFSDCNLFFRPDLKFCEWLKDYANGRLIIDVGSGQGHLVRMLKMVKARAIGIEPNIDKMEWIAWRRQHDGDSALFDINEILQGTVQDYKNIINGLGDKAILVFARPCHSDFVEQGIYNNLSGVESLYITVPQNIDKYNDLGVFKKDAILLSHEGQSEDNEVVYSITRK